MKIFDPSIMVKGWYTGDFEPTAYKTKDFEVGILTHKAGEFWPTHYHNECDEINYLLDGEDLGKSAKPILWIHVPHEYNSRNWLSFGSRSSFELNQPYLYLTVRSIIKKCEDSFTICIFDDNSFQKIKINEKCKIEYGNSNKNVSYLRCLFQRHDSVSIHNCL